MALQQKEQEKQVLMQSSHMPTPQSFLANGSGAALQPANLSSLLAEAAEVSDTESAQEYKIRCSRLQREVELKKEYLAEKESFWHEEMEKLEDLLKNRDDELRGLRSDIASLRVERGQESVDARSRDLSAVRQQQAMELRLSELEIELRSEQNKNAKMQSDNASELVNVRHEMAVERSRTKMFINICLPTLEEYGLQVKPDPAEVASSMVSLINEMKTRTHKVASVINGTPQRSSSSSGKKIESQIAGETTEEPPKIDKLLINGSSEHGGLVTAQGILQGASKCRFSWYSGHKAADGDYLFVPITGVKTPTYNTSADDAGCMLKVEAVPVKEKGVEGEVSTARLGEIVTPNATKARVNAALEISLAGSDALLNLTDITVDGEEGVSFSLVMESKTMLKLVRSGGGGVEILVACEISHWHFDAVTTSPTGIVMLKDAATNEASTSDRDIIRIDTASPEDRDVLLLVLRALASEKGTIDTVMASVVETKTEEPKAELQAETEASTSASGSAPFIKTLDVVGEARVGEKLMACGDIEGGDELCRFQWCRSSPEVASSTQSPAVPSEASQQPIPGAHSPIYYISPDDVGFVLSVNTKVDIAGNTHDAPGQMRTAVADNGNVVAIGPNMKKYVTLQSEGKSLLFKCKATKVTPGSSSSSTPSTPADASSADTDAENVIDGRIVFDEKNATLFKHEAGPLVKLNLGKAAAESIALVDPSGNDNRLVMKSSSVSYELIMEDRVRRDVCLIIFRSAIDRSKKTPQKRKSFFRGRG